MFYDFLSLLFPQCCPACDQVLGKGENVICSTCRTELPRYSLDSLENNNLHIKFSGKVQLSYCYSYYSFRKKSKVQRLLHALKYKGNHEIGPIVGAWIAHDMVEKNEELAIDICVPVPLHKTRQRKRGYNQSECLAKGFADVLQIPLHTDILIKKDSNESQTKRKRWWRWKNASDTFKTQIFLQGEHVVIIDDVVTTGATLEACATALLEAGASKVSIATMAAAV